MRVCEDMPIQSVNLESMPNHQVQVVFSSGFIACWVEHHLPTRHLQQGY